MSTPDFPRFDGTDAIDLDVDAVTDPIRFSKPPFEAELLCHDGRRITLIGAHLKSKALHGAKSKDEAMLISIANRRKQLAQALWARGRVDQVLDEGAEVIVLGDLNDGPGLDVYEELFARSSVEIIMGLSQGPKKQLFDPHATQMIEKTGADPFSARFYPARDGAPLDALLDYILVGQVSENRQIIGVFGTHIPIQNYAQIQRYSRLCTRPLTTFQSPSIFNADSVKMGQNCVASHLYSVKYGVS